MHFLVSIFYSSESWSSVVWAKQWKEDEMNVCLDSQIESHSSMAASLGRASLSTLEKSGGHTDRCPHAAVFAYVCVSGKETLKLKLGNYLCFHRALPSKHKGSLAVNPSYPLQAYFYAVCICFHGSPRSWKYKYTVSDWWRRELFKMPATLSPRTQSKSNLCCVCLVPITHYIPTNPWGEAIQVYLFSVIQEEMTKEQMTSGKTTILWTATKHFYI